MSALLVSEVSTRRDYWRNIAVTPTKIQSSWRCIFVDRSYHMGPFLVGWSANPNPFHPSRGPLAAILPLFPRRLQSQIPVGLNLLLMPGKHVPSA